MEVSKNNLAYLKLMEDIFEVSSACNTKSYIWGGLTIDIFEGKFLREHRDLDGFIANMDTLLDKMTPLYQKLGYQTEYFADIKMFKISNTAIRASFNGVDIKDGIAMWKHIGDQGTVYFPEDWLDQIPRDFYSAKVYTSGIKFEYAIKKNVEMLNPEWKLRDKDHAALSYLEEAINTHRLDKEEFLKQIWCFNPYWIKRGYKEFMLPTVARPLYPR